MHCSASLSEAHYGKPFSNLKALRVLVLLEVDMILVYVPVVPLVVLEVL